VSTEYAPPPRAPLGVLRSACVCLAEDLTSRFPRGRFLDAWGPAKNLQPPKQLVALLLDLLPAQAFTFQPLCQQDTISLEVAAGILLRLQTPLQAPDFALEDLGPLLRLANPYGLVYGGFHEPFAAEPLQTIYHGASGYRPVPRPVAFAFEFAGLE
jgi:hypothetical protein